MLNSHSRVLRIRIGIPIILYTTVVLELTAIIAQKMYAVCVPMYTM